MGSKWKKAKLALGLNFCVLVPRTLDDSPPAATEASGKLSDAALLSPMNWKLGSSRPTVRVPPSLSGLNLSRSGSKSSKTCSICLIKMKQGCGQVIFTAECSHSFHFHCIASNVKRGNQTCPVCREKWKEIPFPSVDPLADKVSTSPVGWPQNDAWVAVVHGLPIPPRRDLNQQHVVQLNQALEPGVFDDDESLNHQPIHSERNHCSDSNIVIGTVNTIEIKTYPEVSATPRSNSYGNFTVLVHLKAAAAAADRQNLSRNHASLTQMSPTLHVPVDLVTVLDTSGSMSGTKLALLKRAMGFVIQNLGSNDRLSVISFSSTACRLFPLRRMSDSGRQQALQAVNSLVANGGTDIAEGLRKGAKIMEDRKEKNPVASIILLSDGKDTYTAIDSGTNQPQPNYQMLLPSSLTGCDNSGFQVPVHAFGFGADHDASSMHSISEISGGTFSFIETEAVLQDAFAQCIGGLLSVVVQGLQLGIECMQPDINIVSLKAGSYPSRVMADGRKGFIDVGDLYADEEKDFLVSVNIPSVAGNGTSLIKVKCVYKDSLTQETAVLESEVQMERPEIVGQAVISLEVDRQRNRVQAAEAMAQARVAAEQGDLTGAVSILENCRKKLSETISARSCDRLCIALDAELKEIQERMASRHVYEASGRAYILSGLSSHSWQRATARGDSTDSSSLVQAYQTPSMTEMLIRSQAFLLGSPSTQRLLQPLLTFGRQPKPR